jgi:hypothetical protein
MQAALGRLMLRQSSVPAGEKERPVGKVLTRPIVPTLAEGWNELNDPMVNAAAAPLMNSGVFNTFMGYLVNIKNGPDPKAKGARFGENIPVVFGGGVPYSFAVPSPLSAKCNQAGAVALSNCQLTGVLAPEDVNVTELGAPAVKVAEVGGFKDALGAAASAMLNG